jgi:hypothetical protein
VLFSKNAPNLPFLAQKAQMNLFFIFALSTVDLALDYKEEMYKKFCDIWPTDCEIIMFEVERKSFFPLCPVGTIDYDHPWCKKFQLCNFEVLHHHNAHHVRYLCAKS